MMKAMNQVMNKFIYQICYRYKDYKKNEYVYGNHYLRYDKIVDKWFSKCKKEVVD